MAKAKIWYGWLSGVATLLLLLTGCEGRGTADHEPSTTGRSDAPDPDSDRSPARSVTLAFAGDVHFEGGVSALLDRPEATVGPMARVLRQADMAVVNLESAVTTRGSQASKELEQASRRYWFRSPPAALGVLARSGIDAVSLANNHGADFGAAGLQDTLRAERSSPVDLVGVGATAADAFRPAVKSVDGTEIAVLAADASPLESNSAIWDVRRGGPGLAAARDDTRLLAAVRQAAQDHDVVAVYLHWGEEGASCPTAGQRELAQNLATAGADVVVGSHTHRQLGAGMLDDTYVSYGLGNFLWYHGAQEATGVLQLEIEDGRVVSDRWVPAEIRPSGGPPQPVTGAARARAVEDWRSLRGCTDLAPAPGETDADADADRTEAAPALPAYSSTIRQLPAGVRRTMIGSSHEPEACPVPLDDLRLLTMRYVGFDGQPGTGSMIVHRDHAADITGVFGRLYQQRFPIRRMELVDAYDGDDDESMAADNTSGYNCRTVSGQSSLSDHAYGAAVDINPVENPYVTAGGVQPPAGRRFVELDRSQGRGLPAGVIADPGVVADAFDDIGWTWGGTWNEPDFQHFSAP